jgi:cobalt-zinc-cadmium efflux system protein
MHEHAHVEAGHVTGRLRVAFMVTIAILVAELVGGYLSNSLALLSDAGHVFTDIAALGLAWYANVQAEKPATYAKTYGFHRAGILAALANALSLVIIAAVITYEAYQRILRPEPVDSVLMFSVAFVGLAANIFIARQLHSEHEEENLNIRSAVLHVVGDAAASAAVLIGGVIILLSGFYLIDPILSVLISVVIIVGGWSIIVDALNIFMEGVPRGLNVEQLVQQLRTHPGVEDVHDLHVWSLAAGVNALSCHILVADQSLSDTGDTVNAITDMLREKYHIRHSTIQLECRNCEVACALGDSHNMPVPGAALHPH